MPESPPNRMGASLDFFLGVDNQASPAIDQARNSYVSLERAMDSVSRGASSSAQRLDKGMASVEKALKDVSKQQREVNKRVEVLSRKAKERSPCGLFSFCHYLLLFF